MQGFRQIDFASHSFFLNEVGGSDYVATLMQGGGYEAPLPMLLSAVVGRVKGRFLDVGANNGLYSILACNANPQITVTAFEPYPPVLAVLRSNIAANHLAERIEIKEFALSDHRGEAPLYLPDQAHGLLETSCSLESDFIPSSEEIFKAKIEKLDDLADIKNVSVIKVDIEGHECAFLRGAQRTLRRDRPIIFAEMMSVAENSFYEISSMMKMLDYVLFRLRPDAAIAADFIKFDPLAWNWGLIPRDKLELFRDAATAHLVEIVKPFW